MARWTDDFTLDFAPAFSLEIQLLALATWDMLAGWTKGYSFLNILSGFLSRCCIFAVREDLFTELYHFTARSWELLCQARNIPSR